MKVVGVTGGMGSGKTTVCRIFELFGVPVFNADTEAKKLYGDAVIKAKVVRLFGKKILDKAKKVDRKKLAEVVFNNKASLIQLNALIHPAVRDRFIAWKKNQKGKKYVIKEAAILIESGAYKEVDCIVSVNSPKNLKINRLTKRDNAGFEDLEKRISEQISDKERDRYSDFIITNDNSHSLIEQVLDIHKRLSKK